ncbi:MAG: cation:proton antiporter domain-containing protein [bacterium]
MPNAVHDIVYHLFLIFAGGAILATFALFARQALIVAYILLGIALGPSLLNLIPDTQLIAKIADVGVIFLLFLLGLNLHPQKLFKLFQRTLLVTLISSFVFASLGWITARAMGFDALECALVGASMMFSSTIIGLKLLPTTVLHHQHTGELIISILLLQDIIAIVLLLLVQAGGSSELPASRVLLLLVSLPALVLTAKLLQQYILLPLLTRFDTIQEYVFLLAVGWCLGIAELAEAVGLSAEMGAFVAGVALAACPLSTFIAEHLKPIRDFFLVLFFFALGAQFDLLAMGSLVVPALILAAAMLLLKPLVFHLLLKHSGESSSRALEVGFRLGQASEFSLLISVLAEQQGMLSEQAAYLIQSTVLLTFIVSPYLIVLRYPTPIGPSEKLRRD